MNFNGFKKEIDETLEILVPILKAKPKVSGSLFKIYRYVRFSKDKTFKVFQDMDNLREWLYELTLTVEK
jgi:uncharacterized protein (DUF2461 family)